MTNPGNLMPVQTIAFLLKCNRPVVLAVTHMSPVIPAYSSNSFLEGCVRLKAP